VTPAKEALPVRGRRAELLGAALIGCTGLQFGSVVVLGRIATRPGGLPVPTLLAIRFAIAAAVLATVLVALRQPLRAAKGEGWRLAALGVGGYAIEAALFFAALRHGTAAAVTLLFYTYPVIVSGLAVFLGRGLPGWLLGASLACAVAGAAIVVVAAGGVEIDSVGVAFALGSSTMISLYLVGAEAVLRSTNSLVGATWVSAAAAVGLGTYAVATGDAVLPVGWRQWGPVLAMAAFTSGAFVCLFAGLRRLGVVRTAIISASEPLVAAVLAAVFLGEAVHRGTLGGGLLIVAGAVAASLARAGGSAGPVMPGEASA
jgi:drug/metabolite transporter (DMT)-like permease